MYIPVPDKFLPQTGNISYCLSHPTDIYAAQDVVQAHIHDYCEIYINVSGDASFTVKNNVYPVKKGDILLSRPNEFHYCLCNGGSIHEHYCLWFNNPGGIFDFLDDSDINFLPSSEELLSSFTALEQSEPGSIEACYNFFGIINYVKNKLESPEKVPSKPAVIPDDLQEMVDFVNQNFYNIKSINKLSERFFVSLSTVNRRFSKHLNMSAKKYLDSLKLSNAKKLILSGKTVTDACFESGFSDCSHFISIFKNTFGETPYKYKKRSEEGRRRK